MTEKRKPLGRGLETLLPSRPLPHAPATALAHTPVDPGDAVEHLGLELLDRNPYQTRTAIDEAGLNELAASISAVGVLQPIVVRPVAGGRYQVIAGERRWMASKLVGKSTVPALLRPVSNEQAMEMTIIENLQRQDLNPIEEAHAFDRLGREFGLTQEQMSLRTGKDRSSVANILRLLRLPVTVQELVANRHLTLGHAKLILSLPTEAKMLEMAKNIVSLSLSVRQTEKVMQRMDPEFMPQPVKPDPVVDPNVREAAEQLQRALGVRVTIRDRNGRGRIVLDYHSLDDFDRILDALLRK